MGKEITPQLPILPTVILAGVLIGFLSFFFTIGTPAQVRRREQEHKGGRA
jgi:hypothetical protein